MDHTDHLGFQQEGDVDQYETIENQLFLKKYIFDFIRNMNLFRGGDFLKRSLVRGPLEAYILIF